MRFRYLTYVLLLLWTFDARSQDLATLAGTVVDENQVGIHSATVQLLSSSGEVLRTATTADKGVFAFDGLTAGNYSLVGSHRRFKTVRLAAFPIHPRDQRSVTITLPVGSGDAAGDSDTPGISTALAEVTPLESAFLRELPLPGRNAAATVDLAPGVNGLSLQSGLPGARTTEFFANGLRPNSNYLTIDGVAANAGNNGTSTNVRGVSSGDWLQSLDALETVVIQNGALTPSLGRSSGAQVVLQSRRGSNELHGSFYGYFRNKGLSANEWFAKEAGLEKPEQSFQNFGATLGGALKENRTFYFLSYEGMRANLPQTSVMDVPDEATRLSAAAGLYPYLAAFPIANGASNGNGTARYTAASTAHSKMNPWSVRLDHQVDANVHAFLRYSQTPTDANYRGTGFETAATVTRFDSKAHALTGGLTWSANPRVTNDLRVNYSRTTAGSSNYLDGIGGAIPLNLSNLLPEGATADNSLVQVNVLGLGSYTTGLQQRQRQEQVHVVNGVTITENKHTFKFGADYRRLYSTIFQPAYSLTATFNGLDGDDGALLSGVAATAVVSANEPKVYPGFTQFSLYGEDNWRVSERTNIMYGVRWDVNPAPEIRRGPTPVTLGDGSGISRFDPLYKTSWGAFSPRGGISYVLDTTPGREMILRAGMGLFQELPYSSTNEFISGAPFSAMNILRSTAFPLSATNRAVPNLPAEIPYGQVSVSDGLLRAPRVLQWNASIEKMLGHGDSFRIGIVGTQASDLLLTENQPQFSSYYSLLRVLSNSASSDYRGLQFSYRRPVGRALTTQLSYTWAHSIDTMSYDHSAVLPGLATLSGYERGDSDFDIRHTLNFAGTYRFPSASEGALGAVFKDWSLDWMFTARSAMPVDLRMLTAVTSNTDGTVEEDNPGLFAFVRPNYMGQPVWISDASAPGGKRLNPDAFAIQSTYSQGTLGRGLIRGFNMWQADFSLTRRIDLNERMRFLVQAQAFNAFNRTNFLDPLATQGANMASSSFGLSSGTLGSATNSGMPAAFGRGGPRTLQLGLRLEF